MIQVSRSTKAKRRKQRMQTIVWWSVKQL